VAKLLRQLGEFILNEFPDDVNLILSGPGLDTRKALAKACLKVGTAEFLKKPDMNDWSWQKDVMSLLRNRFETAGMKMPITALEYITEVIGTDTDRIGVELEKIICYAGESPTLEQIQEVCRGNREAHFFAFTKSMGERKLNATIEALTQTMDNTKDENGECIRLIRMSANHFRKLLDAKIAMHVLNCRTGRDLRSKVKGLSEADQKRLEGNSILSASDWNVGNLGEQATKYTGQELREAIHRLSKVDRSNVSSTLPNRLVLETLIMQIVPKKKSA
jgi:DNA polymerase III delta subunit